MRRYGFFLLLFTLSASASAQPEPLQPGVTVRAVATVAPGAVRLAYDPVSEALFYTTSGGDVYRLARPYDSAVLVADRTDHGLTGLVLGLAVGPDGTLYLTGNNPDGTLNVGRILRGEDDGSGGYTWSTVAETEPYPRSNTPFDHSLNGVTVSPDGAFLFVNSGSRTDHGEVQDNGGAFPGLREVPLTSAILRVPSDADGLVLPNDETILVTNGYLYADGVRNAFDLAFDAGGVLYATENSGDRDDGDELNRVLPGSHLGFPWRMGLHDTPQQFPGYDPDTDLLLNPDAYAVQQGFFYDDPTYPPPPTGVTFTDPVRNLGPDADFYRDEADGLVYDGGETGEPVATLTPHRSPLGLVFDRDDALPGPFTGEAFVLSWTDGSPTGSPLLTPFGDESQDLLRLTFASPTEVGVSRLVRGFGGPIDAVLVDTTLYVIENGSPSGLWAIDFAQTSGVETSPDAAFRLTASPNPFTTEATVALDLPTAQEAVRLDVLDVLGRLVVVLHDGMLAPGRHRFRLDGWALAPGTYAVRVVGAAGTTSRTVTRVR